VKNYRQRIYEFYSSQRETGLAPETIEGLKQKVSLFKKMIKVFFPSNLDVNKGFILTKNFLIVIRK